MDSRENMVDSKGQVMPAWKRMPTTGGVDMKKWVEKVVFVLKVVRVKRPRLPLHLCQTSVVMPVVDSLENIVASKKQVSPEWERVRKTRNFTRKPSHGKMLVLYARLVNQRQALKIG